MRLVPWLPGPFDVVTQVFTIAGFVIGGADLPEYELKDEQGNVVGTVYEHALEAVDAKAE